MSLQDMRDFVRTALDTDTTDLPDTLLDRYIIDGSNRVEQFSDEWIFRAVDYTFATVANQQAYDIRSSARVSGITQPVANVLDVRGPNWSLMPKDHQRQRREWRATSTNKSTPSEFTVWANSLYLWPTPGTIANLSITGYRSPIDWVSTTPTAPDYPAEFHELIAWWALNRAHAHEADAQMADFYRTEFAPALAMRARPWMVGLDAQPLVIGGKNTTEQWRARNGMGPLIYTWE